MCLTLTFDTADFFMNLGLLAAATNSCSAALSLFALVLALAALVADAVPDPDAVAVAVSDPDAVAVPVPDAVLVAVPCMRAKSVAAYEASFLGGCSWSGALVFVSLAAAAYFTSVIMLLRRRDTHLASTARSRSAFIKSFANTPASKTAIKTAMKTEAGAAAAGGVVGVGLGEREPPICAERWMGLLAMLEFKAHY